MKKLTWLLLAPAWLGWAGRTAGDEPLGVRARAILQTHCGGCHKGGKASKGGFGFLLDRDKLVSRLLVVPGKANESDLYLRIRQREMPPPGKPRPAKAEVDLIRRWIDSGAPSFDPGSPLILTVSERDVPGVILADLKKIDPRRRRFVRYLTLAHLAHAGWPAKDLDITREAAGKLLNSLSWQRRIRLPEPLAGGTILRIDLRDYKWTASLWDKLVAVYPYVLDNKSPETRAITRLTGTAVAALRADWFVAVASRPPLYHDLLLLPGTDRALERLLQVDVPGDLKDDNVIRAGFNDSGVSKNNRLIERHDALHGALWRSYDFAANTGRQNLFEHPLGPNTGATSFQPAGGEIIFHLPNGLHGYLLVDALGRRIDKAPGEIVSDPRRPDQRVENGISCMSCHARGLLPKADQVRAHVEKNATVFGEAIVASIRATHPPRGKFQARIEEDNLLYLKALEKFGLHDSDQEPINLVTQRFEGTLDGKIAAAELGLTLEELARFLKQHPDLARILGGLVVPGGTVQREVFQENFAELDRRLGDFHTARSVSDRTLPVPFQGHTGTVNCVVFSPDGKHAASGGDDGTIRLWKLPEGKELACFKCDAEIHALAFSPDGKVILAGGRDRLLNLFALADGKKIRVFRGHTDNVRCLAFSADGKKVVSGGDDRVLRLWDLAGGMEIATMSGHTGAVTSLAWAAGRVLSGSNDGTVRLWNPAKRKQIFSRQGHAGPVLCVALAPDGKTALTGGNDKTVRLWSLDAGKELHGFQGHANPVIAVGMSGGKTLYSASGQHQNPDRIWRRWDPVRRLEQGSMNPGPEVQFGCAAFSPDGRFLLVGGPGGLVRLWRYP